MSTWRIIAVLRVPLRSTVANFRTLATGSREGLLSSRIAPAQFSLREVRFEAHASRFD